MTRRNFFRSALACFGAMVLAPVRPVLAATQKPSVGVMGMKLLQEGGRIRLIGLWNGRVFYSRLVTPQEEQAPLPVFFATINARVSDGEIDFV